MDTKKTEHPKYRRILLKLSGEALGGDAGVSIRPEAVKNMAEQIREVRSMLGQRGPGRPPKHAAAPQANAPARKRRSMSASAQIRGRPSRVSRAAQKWLRLATATCGACVVSGDVTSVLTSVVQE